MKCPKCNGTGDIPRPNGTTLFGLTEVMTCDLCNGVGVVELTNDEWRRTCSTEEFAEWLHDIACYEGICGVCDDCTVSKHEECRYNDGVDGWDEWLKQPHTTIKE